MKTISEIVDETVAYYADDLNRRAVDEDGTCFYVDGDGRMCAVGRCMLNPNDYMIKNQPACEIVADRILKPEYRGHPVIFWEELQVLHDHGSNWCEEGLTERGLRVANEIKQLEK